MKTSWVRSQLTPSHQCEDLPAISYHNFFSQYFVHFTFYRVALNIFPLTIFQFLWSNASKSLKLEEEGYHLAESSSKTMNFFRMRNANRISILMFAFSRPLLWLYVCKRYEYMVVSVRVHSFDTKEICNCQMQMQIQQLDFFIKLTE